MKDDEKIGGTTLPPVEVDAVVKCLGNIGFICPLCGSWHWGSSKIDGIFKGHCHDQQGKGCKFDWLRENDDLYFKNRCKCPDCLIST